MESPVTREIASGVWGWIHDPAHAVEAIVAERGSKLVGFTIYRPFYRTLDANQACFLDDLFVAESERGSGLARSLIARVAQIAKERGWSHVRWVTTQENARARGLYEKVATLMDLLTYRLDFE